MFHEFTAITLTTTETTTSTIISTLTSISTSFAPQETYYAACAPNNIVNQINGNAIGGLNFMPAIPGDQFNDISSVNSAYDCCVQCQSRSTCAGSFFLPGSATCEFYSPDAGARAQVILGGDPNSFALSNGNRAYYYV